jgi:DNA primase catalytic subunit
LAGNQFVYTEGVLSYMGYRVGNASTLTSERRRRILEYVFLGELPQVNDRQYMRTWGKPRTAARLRKLANAVAAFARNARRKRKKNMNQAIADWEADLDYLKKQFYDRRSRDWHWPETVRQRRG